METEKKIEILGAAAKYDICASSCAKAPRPVGNDYIGNLSSSGICHSYTPDGRCVSLLKVLMTNSCQNNCKYCVNRVTNDFERASFEAEELAKLFMELYKRNYVEGLFLSSGIKRNTDFTMEEMIKVLEIVRFRYNYKGYIHLKILPKTSENLVERGARLATRLSINLEAPNPNRLKMIAEEKDFKSDLLDTMSLIQKQVDRGLVRAGHTTQFVVGAAGETDAELLKTTNWLYKHKSLKRAYFSAFIPVENSLPPYSTQYTVNSTLSHATLPSVPLLREHRLYQADWLMRFYNFNLSEIMLDDEGNLILNIDPKLAFALKNKERFPLEINKASYDDLLKIPGIGVTSARRIYRVRKEYKLKDIKELKNLGVVTKRAAPFITIAGKLGARSQKFLTAQQLELFQTQSSGLARNQIELLNA